MSKDVPVCVVFDLDDTLYLERDYVRSGFCAVDDWCKSNLQLNGTGELSWNLFEQGRRGDIFDVALRQLGVSGDQAIIKELVQVYRTHVPQIFPSSDTMRCLVCLKAMANLAMITDGDPASQWKKIDALGIRNSFDLIVATGEWGSTFSKPNPRAFLHVQNAFSSSAHYYYVGDNPAKDFTAPRALGWMTVRIRREAGLHSSMCTEQPLDFELPDLRLLPNLVLEGTPHA